MNPVSDVTEKTFLNSGEYVLEIVANYSQGKVYYGVKLIVE